MYLPTSFRVEQKLREGVSEIRVFFFLIVKYMGNQKKCHS